MSRKELQIWIFGALIIAGVYWSLSFPVSLPSRSQAAAVNTSQTQTTNTAATANEQCRQLLYTSINIALESCEYKDRSTTDVRGHCTAGGWCQAVEYKDTSGTWRRIGTSAYPNDIIEPKATGGTIQTASFTTLQPTNSPLNDPYLSCAFGTCFPTQFNTQTSQTAWPTISTASFPNTQTDTAGAPLVPGDATKLEATFLDTSGKTDITAAQNSPGTGSTFDDALLAKYQHDTPPPPSVDQKTVDTLNTTGQKLILGQEAIAKEEREYIDGLLNNLNGRNPCESRESQLCITFTQADTRARNAEAVLAAMKQNYAEFQTQSKDALYGDGQFSEYWQKQLALMQKGQSTKSAEVDANVASWQAAGKQAFGDAFNPATIQDKGIVGPLARGVFDYVVAGTLHSAKVVDEWIGTRLGVDNGYNPKPEEIAACAIAGQATCDVQALGHALNVGATVQGATALARGTISGLGSLARSEAPLALEAPAVPGFGTRATDITLVETRPGVYGLPAEGSVVPSGQNVSKAAEPILTQESAVQRGAAVSNTQPIVQDVAVTENVVSARNALTKTENITTGSSNTVGDLTFYDVPGRTPALVRENGTRIYTDTQPGPWLDKVGEAIKTEAQFNEFVGRYYGSNATLIQTTDATYVRSAGGKLTEVNTDVYNALQEMGQNISAKTAPVAQPPAGSPSAQFVPAASDNAFNWSGVPAPRETVLVPRNPVTEIGDWTGYGAAAEQPRSLSIQTSVGGPPEPVSAPSPRSVLERTEDIPAGSVPTVDGLGIYRVPGQTPVLVHGENGPRIYTSTEPGPWLDKAAEVIKTPEQYARFVSEYYGEGATFIRTTDAMYVRSAGGKLTEINPDVYKSLEEMGQNISPQTAPVPTGPPPVPTQSEPPTPAAPVAPPQQLNLNLESNFDSTPRPAVITVGEQISPGGNWGTGGIHEGTLTYLDDPSKSYPVVIKKYPEDTPAGHLLQTQQAYNDLKEAGVPVASMYQVDPVNKIAIMSNLNETGYVALSKSPSSLLERNSIADIPNAGRLTEQMIDAAITMAEQTGRILPFDAPFILVPRANLTNEGKWVIGDMDEIRKIETPADATRFFDPTLAAIDKSGYSIQRMWNKFTELWISSPERAAEIRTEVSIVIQNRIEAWKDVWRANR